MTSKDPDFIGTESSKEPDDPPFRIDPGQRKIIINVKSRFLNNLHKMMLETVKLKDKKQERAMIRSATVGMATIHLLNHCKDLDRTGATQRVVTKMFFNMGKDILTHVLQTVPERKVKAKEVAKDRYDSRGGSLMAQRATHRRMKKEDPENYFHWECPICEPTEHFDADVFKQRQGHWKSLMLAIKKHPKLREYLKVECSCEIEDYNIQTLYPAYRYSPFCKTKSHTTKYPKTGQTQKDHAIENEMIKLKDEGHSIPKPKTVDDRKIIVYLHQVRSAGPRPEISRISGKPEYEKAIFQEVARMQGDNPSNWKAYRNVVLKYCEDHGSNYWRILRPRERRGTSDDHTHNL